jgi:nitrosocyanin
LEFKIWILNIIWKLGTTWRLNLPKEVILDMNKTAWIVVAVVVVLVLAGGAYFIRSSQKAAAPTNDQTITQTQPSPTDMAPDMSAIDSTGAANTEGASTSAQTQGAVKHFTVTGSSFKFAPSTLTVNKGDKVQITFQNSSGIHDFVIDEFNVESTRISEGQTDTVEFTADKAGSFKYYCSVGNHRQMGMEGTLVVQ